MNKYPLLLIALFLASSARATPLVVEHATDEDAAEIYVSVQLGGVNKRFALDTASDFTNVARDRQTAKFFTLGKGTSIGAGGKTADCDLVAPPKIFIGKVKIVAPLIARCKSGAGNNLGLDVLAGQVMRLDFKAMDFSLISEPPAGLTLQKLVKLGSGHIGISALIGGTTLTALFDTGLGMSLVSAEFVAAHPDLFAPAFAKGVMNDINGAKMPVKGYSLKSLQIGDQTLNDVIVAAFESNYLKELTGEDIQMVLGNNVITKANWTVDLKANRWAIEKLDK